MLQAPFACRQPSRNGRRRVERHVNAAEIVPRHEQRKHQLVILPFLAEGVRQPREAAILHPNRQVRPLNVGRANLAGL